MLHLPERTCGWRRRQHRAPLRRRAFSWTQMRKPIMAAIPYSTALIVGAGPGISASVARGLAAAGLKVGLAARNIDKLAPLAAGIGAETFAVDASDPAAVARLFEDVDGRLGEPDVVLYNASARAHGPIAELDPAAVRKAVEISAFGAFLVIQQA